MSSETARLLDLDPEQEPEIHTSRDHQHRRTYIKLAGIFFCVNLGFGILGPTQTKIFESIYCWQWYEKHDPSQLPKVGYYNGIPEELCKIAPVQQDISTLLGWLAFFDGIPTLLLAIPFGILSDYVGRRRLCLLNLCVITVQQLWITFVTLVPDKLDLHTIWFETILNFLSGGKIVAQMLSVCIITDITPKEELSTAFFRLLAVAQCGGILSPIIAALLIKVSPWSAIIVGLVILGVMCIFAFTIPETLSRLDTKENNQNSNEDSYDYTSKDGLRNIFRKSISAVRELSIVWTDWRIGFLVILYPLHMMLMATADLVQRYVSNRYGWTLADATYLYSVQAVAATIILFLILPYASDLMTKKLHLNAIQKDVNMSRIFLLILAISVLIQGLAPSSWILIVGLLLETLAAGIAGTLRALGGSFVPPNDRGSVFSVLALSETLSAVIAYPTTAALFNIGVGKGGGLWLGLPYYVTSVMAILAFVAMCSMRFDSRKNPDEPDVVAEETLL